MSDAVKVSIDAKGELVTEKIKLEPKPLNKALISKADKRFEWLVSFLICRYHFVHRTLGMMHKYPENRIPTMGVNVVDSGSFNLYYNPEWFDSLSDAEGVYVFNHEVLHLLLHHCTTRKLSNDELANVAQDLAVNELIQEVKGVCERPRKPDGTSFGCHVDELAKDPFFSDILHKQTAEWYYDYLRNKQKEQEQKGKGKGNQGGNDKGHDLGTCLDSHEGFGEHEVADERVRSLVKEIDTCEMWGNMPMGDREVVLAAQVRRVNWRNKLRQWWGNQISKITYHTVKRPNRRFGYLMPGSKKMYEDPYLVVVDTSGSVWGYGLLDQFLATINQIVEDGVPIDLMQVDCEIQTEPKPFDRRQCKFEFKGKGGTSFDPIIEVVEKRRYRGVIIATDGEASPPNKPKNAEVLWVLPKGKKPPVDWGERIYVERY